MFDALKLKVFFDMKVLNVVFTNSTLKTSNLGCAALCYCALYTTAEIIESLGMRYRFFLTESGECRGCHILVIKDKNIHYEDIENPIPISFLGLCKKIVYLRRTIKSLILFKNADFIFDMGEGDSFSDIYGKERFATINKNHKFARFLKKRYCFLPQTIGPFKDEYIKKQAFKSIIGAECVMVRDKTSFLFVKEVIPLFNKVEELIDLAFFLPFTRRKFLANVIHVGLNISALLWYGGYTRNNQFGLKVEYNRLIRQVIDYFTNLPNIVLHLVPHVIAVSDNDIENDYAISYDLCNEYNKENLIVAPYFRSPIDAKSYIAGMDFFLGSRMHSTIAAFSSGVPVVPLAYSRKFNGLFIETLGYNIVMDLKSQNNQSVYNGIVSAFEKKNELKSIIKGINEGLVVGLKNRYIDIVKNALMQIEKY